MEHFLNLNPALQQTTQGEKRSGYRWITWGHSKRSGGEAWAAELRQLSSLQRGERERPLQATRGKEFWGSCPPFLGDTISLTANLLLVSFLYFLCHDLQATDECREQEQQSFHGKSSSVDYTVQKVSPENIHTSNTIQTEKDLFTSLRIYMYM